MCAGDSSNCFTNNYEIEMDCLNQLKEQVTCCVCLELYKDPQSLHCRHVLCHACANRLMCRKVIVCPECRSKSSESQVKPDCRMRNIVELIARRDHSGNEPSAPPLQEVDGNVGGRHIPEDLVAPSAPSLESHEADIHHPADVVRITLRHCGDGHRLCHVPNGFCAVNGRFAAIHDKRLTCDVGSGAKMAHWTQGPRPTELQNAMSCAQVVRRNKVVACVVACDERGFGLMHFNASGKFQYYISENKYCSVDATGPTVVALSHQAGKVLVCRLDEEQSGDGNPWKKVAGFKLHNSCRKEDTLVVLHNSIYVYSTADSMITQYSFQGDYLDRHAYRPAYHGRFQPKLTRIDNHLAVVDPTRREPQLVDLATGQCHSVRVEGAGRAGPIDMVCVGDKVWIVYPVTNFKGVECVPFIICP